MACSPCGHKELDMTEHTLIIGESVLVRGQKLYEKYLYLSLNCVIDLKVLKKVTNKPKREASEYGLDLEAQIRSK